MNEMLAMVLVSNAIMVAVLLFVYVMVLLIRIEISKAKKNKALKGISAGISARIYAIYPDSEWRWVCYPNDFTENKGVARIEIRHHRFDDALFMDVCLSADGFMALHVLNVVDLAEMTADAGVGYTDSAEADFDASADEDEFISPASPASNPKPHDEASVATWYNIVLIDTLTAVIDDLNAKGEVCIHIGLDGKAYVDNGALKGDDISVVHDFGEMPDISLWGHIVDKLAADGLFAEIREENSIFISWA